MNTDPWIKQIIETGKTVAIPIMTHPGIELLGKKVKDAVTDGQTHYRAIAALNERFPQSAAVTMIMDLTVEAALTLRTVAGLPVGRGFRTLAAALLAAAGQNVRGLWRIFHLFV